MARGASTEPPRALRAYLIPAVVGQRSLGSDDDPLKDGGGEIAAEKAQERFLDCKLVLRKQLDGVCDASGLMIGAAGEESGGILCGSIGGLTM